MCKENKWLLSNLFQKRLGSKMFFWRPGRCKKSKVKNKCYQYATLRNLKMILKDGMNEYVHILTLLQQIFFDGEKLEENQRSERELMLVVVGWVVLCVSMEKLWAKCYCTKYNFYPSTTITYLTYSAGFFPPICKV